MVLGSGSLVAGAVGPSATTAAAGTALAPAAIPNDYRGSQQDGGGDQSAEKDIQPHIRQSPAEGRSGAGAGLPTRRGRTAR